MSLDKLVCQAILFSAITESFSSNGNSLIGDTKRNFESNLKADLYF